MCAHQWRRLRYYPMEPLFTRAAILGLGLMGGSLGLALRSGGIAAHVVGYDATAGVAERARERGAVDEAVASVGSAVTGADVVVLATPVLAERELLRALASHVGPDALVTDLGSAKARVVAWAAELLTDPSRFIGGHPMAGSERSGIDAADGDLFRGAVWCLTPSDDTRPDALARLEEMIGRLGATPQVFDAERHDRLVAGASHLPLVVAAALVRALGTSADWDELGRLAAGGFRDTTRLASGDTTMARDICLSNGPAVVGWLDAYIGELARLRDRIAAGDAAVREEFASARALREAWLRARGHSGHSEQ